MPENARDAGQSYEKQGFLLRDLYRLDEAEAAFRRAIKVDPSLLEARRALIALLGLERRGTEQETELWGLLERTPRTAEALRVLAQAGPAIPPDGLPPGLDEGQALERVLRAEPTNDHARAALASYYRGRGDFQSAERLLSEAPRKTGVIELESKALAIDNGDLDSGESYFERPRSPVSPEILPRFYRLQGDWWEAKGDLAQALDAYRRALKADPRSVELKYRTGRVLAALKRQKEAEPYLTYAQKTLTLKNLVARLPDDNPDPRLCAEAEALCRDMGREAEAEAWKKLANRSDATR
jgi:tetratricopeptide (TPR) repeat protein